MREKVIDPSREIERGLVVQLDQLHEHPNNPSTHTEQDIAYLRASLRRYGQVRDLVVRRLGNAFQMIAGHGMRKAMLEEDWASASCTVVPSSWSDVQAAGYLLIDNHRAADDDRALLILWEQQINAGESLASVGTDIDEVEAVRAMLNMDSLTEAEGYTSRGRAVTDAQQNQHVKLVLYMHQIDKLEAAIRKSGLSNRGDAVAAICDAYLENDWIPPNEVLHG